MAVTGTLNVFAKSATIVSSSSCVNPFSIKSLFNSTPSNTCSKYLVTAGTISFSKNSFLSVESKSQKSVSLPNQLKSPSGSVISPKSLIFSATF